MTPYYSCRDYFLSLISTIKIILLVTIFQNLRFSNRSLLHLLQLKLFGYKLMSYLLLRAVQSGQYFFLENVLSNIQNLIYGISIALEVNELHTFERS